MIGTLLLNRYEILEKIGEGGMGVVYKAKCTILNRFVAIKILKTELSNNEDFISRFKREANSIASLSHPNIVNIYDVGSEKDLNFIIMEYVKGKTLKQVIKDNIKLNQDIAVDITLQIAKALQYAHKNNIIHRDVKPDNILISAENVVKLTDFGIAKVSDEATITNSSGIIGSVHYFSPEQAKGKLVDCRTDIYALGVVMYEMLTGKVPFNGDTSISVAMMHIQEPVIPPKEIISEIPENINRVILKALEKEPVNRFQSAKEFAETLNSIKVNPNFEVNFKGISDFTTVIMSESEPICSDTIIDPTVVINQEQIEKTELISETISANINDKKILSDNAVKRKKRKLILAASFITLIAIIYILGTYLSVPSTDAKTEPAVVEPKSTKTTTPEENTKLPENEKKNVPSVTGKTLDVAKSIIINNGFELGNITSEYNDTIPNGLIISQSPSSDTSYEKNGKIDIVISQGQRPSQPAPQTQPAPQIKGNGNSKDKSKHKNK